MGDVMASAEYQGFTEGTEETMGKERRQKDGEKNV